MRFDFRTSANLMSNKSYLTHNIYGKARLIFSALHHDIRERWLGQHFPTKPSRLQFIINDICNSQHMKSALWERTEEQGIGPESLHNILLDPLFSEIHHVHIAGKLAPHPNLLDIVRVMIDALPKLNSMQMSTNVLQSRLVVEQIMASGQLMKEANIGIKVSMSFDGVTNDYSVKRGLEGILVSADKVVLPLIQNQIPVSVDYTLSSQNVYFADDVLIWSEKNDIQECNFNLEAEVKGRYRGDNNDQCHYSPDQYFHAMMFFDKLAHYRGTALARRKFYGDLVNQLDYGLSHQDKCEWHTRGIRLDIYGNISFFPAKSAVLGSILEKSAFQIVKERMTERRRIIRMHCDSCHHERIGPLTTSDLIRRRIDIINTQRQQRRYKRQRGLRLRKSILSADHDSPRDWRRVLITGWYGTETAGDKAILAEVLDFLKTYALGCQVTLTTIDRKVSRQTQLELVGFERLELVDIAEGHAPALIESVDAVIIGGGPLMETTQMEHVWRMFAEANRRRKARIVFGCGVGPLYSERLNQITGDILRMTTAGFLRDEESHALAGQLAPGHSLSYACDPSLAFLQRWLSDSPRPFSGRNEPVRVAGLLRANTKEFVADQTNTGLEVANSWAALQIARVLESVSMPYQARTELLPMNSHWLGGDDRIFNRQVAGYFRCSEAVQIERRYLPIEALLQALYSADAAVAMRYHGHLFCMALGIPFFSIDYTGRPGKVHSLLERIDYGEFSEDWRSIDVDHASKQFKRLMEARDYWSAFLKQQANKLVDELHHTYTQVFRVQVVNSPLEIS